MKSKSTAKLWTPLNVTTFAVSVPLIFLIGWAVGRGGGLAQDSVSSWVGALATAAIAILTFILATETWRLREMQTLQLAELKRENIRPNINIQLDPSKVGLNFIDIKIANLGRGIARKVIIRLIDQQGNVIGDGVDPVAEKLRKLAIFRQGVEYMGIGQVISSFVFSFIDLRNEMEGKLFNHMLRISAQFEDVEGNKYNNEFIIDFAQYDGIKSLGGGDPLHLISEEFKKLNLVAQKINSSQNRIGVNVYDSGDREAIYEMQKEFVPRRLTKRLVAQRKLGFNSNDRYLKY